jgi:transcriptional regulator with XRE-family HTH domain
MVRIPAEALAETRRAAALLARRIRAAGRGQREVAQALGVSLSHLNKVLTGRHPLKVERLYAILAELGIEPVDYFTELHGPAASLPAFHLEVEDDAGGGG